MATLNTNRLTPVVTTFEGGAGVKFSKEKELHRAVLTSLLWEDNYYESGVKIADRIKQLVTEVSPAKALAIALEAKLNARLRHVPLFVAREVMRNPQARVLAGSALETMVTRPDDMTEFVAMYWKDGKQPLAAQAKKALANAFNKFDAYQIAKYKKEGKEISLVDVLRLVHAKPATKAQADALGKLTKGQLKNTKTWEAKLSSGQDKKQVFESMTKEKTLGGMATLRNLRNMTQAGMSKKDIEAAIANIETKKLLPKDVIMAYVTNPSYAKALDTLFFKLFDKDKKYSGATAIHIDCSGSMDARLSGKSEMTYKNAATALAMIAQEMFDDVDIYAFGTDSVQLPSIRGFGLFEATRQPDIKGYGTNVGLSVQKAFNKRKYDRVIVITDEQGHDRLVLPQGVKGYMINCAAHAVGIGYGNWTRIDGWSDAVLDYIVEAEAKGF